MTLTRSLSVAMLLVLPTAGCAPVVGNYVWAEAYPKDQAAADTFLIKPGDLVEVRVVNQEQMAGKARVRSDGKITLPFLNDVQVAGYTPDALVAQLETRLKDFVKNPLVTISVDEAKPAPISVIGKVVRAGQYPLESSTTVLQALACAGGLTEFARRDRIFVLRAGPPSVRIRFRYESLLLTGGPAASLRLRGGDVVAVE